MREATKNTTTHPSVQHKSTIQTQTTVAHKGLYLQT